MQTEPESTKDEEEVVENTKIEEENKMEEEKPVAATEEGAIDPMSAATTDATVAAALQVAQMETEALAQIAPTEIATAAATAASIAAIDPSLPADRDVKLGDDTHPATMLMMDLILLHKVLMPSKEDNDEKAQESDPEIQDLSTKLTNLILEGRKYELAGLKDVPRPFLVGKGRFFEKKDDEWTQLEEDTARERVLEAIVARFKTLDRLKSIQGKEAVEKELLDGFDAKFRNKDAEAETSETPASTSADSESATVAAISHGAPRPCDILFLHTNQSPEDTLPYDHQTGNKHLLYLASQKVVVDTKEAAMRVEIALKLLNSKIEVSTGAEMVPKQPRYILHHVEDNQTTWKELGAMDLAEFATIFVFEVYLEKQIHGTPAAIQTSLAAESIKPSLVPLEQPTVHDVLFGRGGMTNGHPGNRRFRDIIALHRPDYIRATKMDKPKVARRIVRAIRLGNPPGRFLKKGDDGKWYDVGDRCAAEKTSQGLRERSNAEKRQRSALREALRIRREDLTEDAAPSAKKPKVEETSDIPLSLNMKEKKAKPAAAAKKTDEGEGTPTEDLPPNAVDKDGNILVTDHDILCGRGGLTNHHKGNKRFRDVVALHRPDYVRAPKIQKPSVARVIVRAIRNGDPPGRFLKKDKKTGLWYDIGDKRAAEKTSQALREKTKEEQSKAPGLSPFVDHAALTAGAANGPTPVLPNIPAIAAEGETKAEAKGEPAATDATKAEEEETGMQTEEKAEGETATGESGEPTGAAATVLTVEI